MRQISLGFQLAQFPNVSSCMSIALKEYYNQQQVVNKYLLESNLIKIQHIHMLLHKYLLQFHTCICHRIFSQFFQTKNSLTIYKFYLISSYKIKLFPISPGISLSFQLKELEVEYFQITPCRRN